MAFEVYTDPGFQKEFGKLAEADQEKILDSLTGLVAHPLKHPQARRLKGSKYPGSFRLRVGAFRILALALEAQDLVLLTTVFKKKREADYDLALERHEGRLRAQGPPVGEFVRKSRRQR